MADKTKTIKSATDKELDDLIARLRKENELQSLICDIKRKSSEGYTPYDYQQGISTETPIESLYHFGIPGMRWGKRLAKSMVGPTSEDHNKTVELKKKKMRQMSNQELKTLNTRLQLEKQYKELTKRQTAPGQKMVSELLSNSGKQVAQTYIIRYMTKSIDKLIKNLS